MADVRQQTQLLQELTMVSYIHRMRKYLPISDETTQQLQEVVRHCNIRVDGWCLHIVIVLLALMSYHWGVQLSSPAAEIELPYFVTLMSQAVAMQLWQLTTSTTLVVFLLSSIFKSLGRLTLWFGGGLITASIWGVVQFYLMIGKASYESIVTDDTTEIYSTFYLIPLFGFFWVFLMLIQAHMGLVVFRTTEEKSFMQSWHKLPLHVKLILPVAVIFSLFMTAIDI